MSKNLHLLFNHKLTPEQENDAIKTLQVTDFIYLNDELQKIWSNVPSNEPDLKNYLNEIINHIKENVTKDDVVLIQGDFGATYMMVDLVRSLDGKAVYATTKRSVVEVMDGDKVNKQSVFRHEIFREYKTL
ncbi:MAG: hypothetical protein FNT15_05115 [Sulfurovum sp.]|nr:MAG: hypothetical protein FNT15_05115 [Sulfurovum sp.]